MTRFIISILVILILATVIFTLLQRYLKDRDWKKQMDGKIPERETSADFHNSKEEGNPELEAEKLRIQAQNTANILGPK